MKYLKSLVIAVGSAGLLLSVVPVLAQAQQYVNYCNFGYAMGNYNCAPGTLQVYVQVTNSVVNAPARNPQDFTVVVTGVNPSPSTFVGSLQGTPVSVGGAYTVRANQLAGYQPTYSQGCQGTLGAGQTGTCIITESSNTGYYPFPQPYPYPYNGYQQLSCAPASQSVGFGQTATFTAVGGIGGAYSWQTANQTYQNIGPTLNVVLPVAGTQAVTVTNAGQTATCVVNVTGSNFIPAPTPSYISPSNPVGPTGIPGVTIFTPAPSLPNTGFEPTNGASLAFAVVALIAAAMALFPYVRATASSLFA